MSLNCIKGNPAWLEQDQTPLVGVLYTLSFRADENTIQIISKPLQNTTFPGGRIVVQPHGRRLRRRKF
jgi:hypothetical protein